MNTETLIRITDDLASDLSIADELELLGDDADIDWDERDAAGLGDLEAKQALFEDLERLIEEHDAQFVISPIAQDLFYKLLEFHGVV